MERRRFRSLQPALLGALLMARPCLAQAPSLDVVLERMGAYQLTYESSAFELVAEERYDQRTKRLKKYGGATIEKRRLDSTFFLVRLQDGEASYGFREVTKVDGKSVDKTARPLAEVLSEPTQQAIDEATSISVANTRYNIGRVYRNINLPLQVFELLHPRHRTRFHFTAGPVRRIAGRTAMQVDFVEQSSPSIITDGFDKDVPAHGSVTVDVASGAILRTELRTTGPAGTYIKAGLIAVDYRYDEPLQMWLPERMEETFELDSEVLYGRATYRNFRRFHTSARLVTPN